MTCKFVLKNGKICSRNPIKDGYCWQHNPSSSTSISVSASTEKKSVEKKSVEKKSVEKKSVELEKNHQYILMKDIKAMK